MHTHGREKTRLQHCGGAIFVDHASGYIHISPQVHLNTHETIKAKEQYEILAEKVRELYSKARDRVSEVDFKEKGDQVLEYIRSNPGKAVLIALAAGFLVGYVTRPRD